MRVSLRCDIAFADSGMGILIPIQTRSEGAPWLVCALCDEVINGMNSLLKAARSLCTISCRTDH